MARLLLTFIKFTDTIKNVRLILSCLIFLLIIPALISGQNGASYPGEDPSFIQQRARLADTLKGAGQITSPQAERAFRTVPRQLFLPEAMASLAYQDLFLPGIRSQTLPSPGALALVIRYLNPNLSSSVLVAGTGTGYAAAVLSRISGTVYAVENYQEAAENARSVFSRLGYTNILLAQGKNFYAYQDSAPFDCILIHGAVQEIPFLLVEQLSEQGRMIVPLRDPSGMQMLVFLERRGPGVYIRSLGTSLFSPLDY